MNKCRLMSALLVMTLLFAACKKQTSDKNFLNAIPKNAIMVLEIKNQQIYEKGADGFSNLIKVAQNMIPDLEVDLDQFSNILTGKDASFGINVEKSYIYSAPTNKSRKEFLGAFIAEVTDKDKLEAQISKINPSLKIVKNGDYNLIDNKSSLLAWNNNVLVILGGDFEESDLDAALMLDPQNSLTTNEDFQSFLKNKNDLALWLGTDQIVSNLPTEIPQEYMEIWKDTYMHFGLNFNLGNVKMTMKMEPEAKFREFEKKYKLVKDDFDNSILELFPAESLFALKLSMNVKNYLSFVSGMSEVSSILEKETKITENIENLKGDIFFSLYDIKNLIPQVALAFTMKEDNISKLNSLVSESTQTVLSKKNYASFNVYGQNIYFGNKKDKVYITNEEQAMNAFTDKGYKENLGNSSLGSLFKEHPIVMYLCLDPDKFPKQLQFMLGSSNSSKELIKFLSFCEHLVVYSDGMTSYSELKFKDQEKNSLNTILEFVQKQVQ